MAYAYKHTVKRTLKYIMVELTLSEAIKVQEAISNYPELGALWDSLDSVNYEYDGGLDDAA